MDLAGLWRESKIDFQNKQISQLVAIAGDGQLRDNNETSNELRHLFDQLQSDYLALFISQILDKPFPNSGYVLQDLVNQVGKRLGFKVEYGRYKGVHGQPGHDGLWRLPSNDHAIVVEVKTTDAYRIDLDRIVSYRKALVAQGEINESTSSVLVVVGREDTGGLESQVRGSRHAWDVRLISIDALVRLMKLSEEVEEPETIGRIHGVLIPREFTKLDDIIELLFVTASDVKQEELVEPDTHDESESTAPASFHQACIERTEPYLDITLVRRSKTKYSSSDERVTVTCQVSRYYDRPGYHYWFAFHPHQSEFLEQGDEGYVVFGCGSPKNVLVIPYTDFRRTLDPDYLNITERGDSYYYHIHISSDDSGFWLVRKRGVEPLDLSDYAIG